MIHSVKTFRAVGMEAKWTKSHGKPFIAVRDPQAALKHQRETWYLVTRQVWERITSTNCPREGFTQATLIADIFSVPA